MNRPENRHMMRRKDDREPGHQEIHMDIQPCPMTPESVAEMLQNQKKILSTLAAVETVPERLEKIEKTMFAGRIALSTTAFLAVAVLSTFEWFRTHISVIREFLSAK